MCERRTLPMPGTERGWGGATTSGNCLGRFLVRYSGSKQAGRQAGRSLRDPLSIAASSWLGGETGVSEEVDIYI